MLIVIPKPKDIGKDCEYRRVTLLSELLFVSRPVLCPLALTVTLASFKDEKTKAENQSS